MTQRQVQILAAIIEQYAEVAAPVGSVTLAKLFGVSSATIRAEMARLEEAGLISQPHTSAGRVPTDKGYRIYVNQLTQQHEEAATTAIERPAKALNVRVAQAGRADLAIRAATDMLVELTHNVGLATIDNQLYLSGFERLFTQPEFGDMRSVHEVARLLDNIEPWLREVAPNEALNVYIGSENPIGKSSGCSLIISRFSSPFSDYSYIGVLGPTRQSYREVMSLVRHAGEALEANVL